MDFTREPIIETIITPKDGHKLVIRNSKGVGQEEFFVDAVEVVSFGHAFFFRSLERPKSFLVPITDYEVLEVREARMVLKNIGTDRSIKIGGGREGSIRAAREAEKGEAQIEEATPVSAEQEEQPAVAETKAEVRLDKKRDRRRHYRRRRNGKEEAPKEEETAIPPLEEGGKVDIAPPEEFAEQAQTVAPITSGLLSSLLQPPPTLISETIRSYRENALFKSAFFIPEDEQYKPHDKAQELLNEEDDFTPSLQEPTFEPLEAEQQGSEEEQSKELEKEGSLNNQPPEEPSSLESEPEMVLPLFVEEELMEIKEEDKPFEEEDKPFKQKEFDFEEKEEASDPRASE